MPPTGPSRPPEPRHGDRHVVPLLAVLFVFQPLSTDLFLPSLPGMAASLGLPAASVQSTLWLYIAVFAGTQLVAGPVSDRFGRRPVVLTGLAAYTLGSLCAALAPSLGLLLAGRALQAAGACCAVVCARATVRDRFEPALGARRLAQAMSWVALMPLLAPLAGGVLDAVAGWRASFWAMAAAGGAAWLFCSRWLGESLQRRHRSPLRPGPLAAHFGAVLRSPAWLGFTLAGAALYAGLFGFLLESSFVLRGLHGLSPVAFGVALSVVTGHFLVGTMLARRLLPRLGIQHTIALAGGLAAASGTVLAAAVLLGLDTPVVLVVGAALFVMTHGLCQPAWQAGSVAPFPRQAGAAAALTGFVQNLVAAAVGLGVAALHDGSAWPLALMMLLGGWSALLVAGTLVRRHGGVDRVAPAAPLPAR